MKKTKEAIKKFLTDDRFIIYFFIVFFALLIFINNDDIKKYSDSISAISTAVYTGFTMLICIANVQSAKASQKQLKESKKQFEETKRLNLLPCFDIHFEKMPSSGYLMTLDVTDNDSGDFTSNTKQVQLKNVGSGIAKNISCIYYSDAIEIRECFNVPLLPIGDLYNINIMFCAKTGGLERKENTKAYFNIQFEDILDNKYNQTLELEYVLSDETPQKFYILQKRISAPKLIKEQEQQPCPTNQQQ